MFLTLHATTGAFIGQNIDNIYLAFVLGLASHFLLDLIPHGQELKKSLSEKLKLQTLFKMFTIDFIIMCLVLVFILTQKKIDNYYVFFASVFGAILPDFLVGISEVSKKYFLGFKKFHHAVHSLIMEDSYPLIWGMIFQAIILLLLLFYL